MKSIYNFTIKRAHILWNSIKRFDLLIIGFLALSLIALIIPIIIIKDRIEGLKLGIDLIATITTFLTLIIAIKLFDRFGIRKRVIDYQTDCIIKLVEELRMTMCRLKGEKITYFVWFTNELGTLKEILKEHKEDNKLVVFHHGKSLIIPKNIQFIMNDLWLPKPIRDRMSFLDFSYSQLIMSEKVDPQKFIVVEFEQENQDGFLIKEEVTSIQFIECIESLILELKKWLELHASIKIDLNIEPRSI